MSDMITAEEAGKLLDDPFNNPGHLANAADAMGRVCKNWQTSTARYHFACRDTIRALMAQLEDAKAAQAEVQALRAERDDLAAIRGAFISLPAVYAHQINTGVREVYDPLQRFYRMEDVLRVLIPKGNADDRA